MQCPTPTDPLVKCAHTLSREYDCGDCGGIYHICSEAADNDDYHAFACDADDGCAILCEGWGAYYDEGKELITCDETVLPCSRRKLSTVAPGDPMSVTTGGSRA